MERVIVAMIFGIAIGTGIGGFMVSYEWRKNCEAANIQLVEHKSYIDGLCISNWVECVHLPVTR